MQKEMKNNYFVSPWIWTNQFSNLFKYNAIFAIETNTFLCWKPEQTLQPALPLTGSYQTLWSLSNYPPFIPVGNENLSPQILSEQKSQEISQRCIRNPGWGLRGNPPGFGGDSPGWTIWHQVAGLAANFVFSSPHHSLSSLLDRYILWFAQIYFVI